MVERFFRELTVNRLRRGVFHSVPELVPALEQYIAQHTRKPKPFIWTAKATDILAKVTRARKKLTQKTYVTLIPTHYTSAPGDRLFGSGQKRQNLPFRIGQSLR